MSTKAPGRNQRLVAAVDRRIAQLTSNRGRLQMKDGLSFKIVAPTSSGGSGGGGGTGGTPDPPTPPTIVNYPLTVPNNSTATIPIKYGSCSGVHLTGHWKRGSSQGFCEFQGHHDGSTGVFRILREDPGPGFNRAGFSGTISGSDFVLTFAADNAGSDIHLRLTINLSDPF